MPPREFLPEHDPVVDLKSGLLTEIWKRPFRTLIAAVQSGAANTVWSTVGGVADWRSANSLITSLAASVLTSGTLGADRLPAGAIRQVVVGTYNTQTSSASSTFADTGLTATITPSSVNSKILVVVFQAGLAKDTNNTGVSVKLRRGTTDLATFAVNNCNNGGATGQYGEGVGTVYLDSPASVSAQTYTTQFASAANVANAYVQMNGSASAIALLEVQG